MQTLKGGTESTPDLLLLMSQWEVDIVLSACKPSLSRNAGAVVVGRVFPWTVSRSGGETHARAHSPGDRGQCRPRRGHHTRLERWDHRAAGHVCQSTATTGTGGASAPDPGHPRDTGPGPRHPPGDVVRAVGGEARLRSRRWRRARAVPRAPS